jgi:hypothetical protein
LLGWCLACDRPRHANRWWLDGALAWLEAKLFMRQATSGYGTFRICRPL